VWCGNNEIEEGDWHWGYDDRYRTHPHYALFHHDLPQIVTREDPSKFYWISSPYSPDYKSPRDPTVGDQHPWKVSLQMPGGADWWEYRNFVDRFPNEGGVLGCSTPATLKDFLPENERYLLSPSWEHHDNPFAINDTTPGKLGHAYQTVDGP
jgi:beta-mannosidase